jgi:hypothetical protein
MSPKVGHGFSFVMHASDLLFAFDARRLEVSIVNASSHTCALVYTSGDLGTLLETVKIRLRHFSGPVVRPGQRVDEFTKSTSARTSTTAAPAG